MLSLTLHVCLKTNTCRKFASDISDVNLIISSRTTILNHKNHKHHKNEKYRFCMDGKLKTVKELELAIAMVSF